MRRLVLLAFAACGVDSWSMPQDAPPELDAELEPSDVPATADAPGDMPSAHTHGPWTFAVLSDLHLPNPKAADVDRVVQALIAHNVRLVVITGDSTNGSAEDHPRSYRGIGWPDVTRALAPLHEAGIAVLPMPGNHDTYLPWQRDHYAAAFHDLTRWAEPLSLSPQPPDARGHARPPFSYSVDVDGVHLSLAYLVAQAVEPEVAHWLTEDLAAAAGAKQRIVFGHVPMSSVIGTPHTNYIASLGGILERGRATLHVAGHEHVVWDEDVRLPNGAKMREVLVGCSSGFYIYAPSEHSQQRAHCTPIADPFRREPMHCKMPHGGGAFELARGRKNRHVEHARTNFTLFTVDGDAVDVEPMSLDGNGRAIPFYLDQRD